MFHPSFIHLPVQVRAENTHGLSLPSPKSPWFTTLPPGDQIHPEWTSVAELEKGRQRMASPRLRLERTRPVNATSVRLTWRMLEGDDPFHLISYHFIVVIISILIPIFNVKEVTPEATTTSTVFSSGTRRWVLRRCRAV